MNKATIATGGTFGASLLSALAASWLYRRPAPSTCISPSQQTRLFFWLSVASPLTTTF